MGQADAGVGVQDSVRVARRESRNLAKTLQGGTGRDETSHAYKHLMTLVRDARESGRKMFLEKPTLDKVDAANQLLDEIAPYYSGGS